MAPPVRGDDGTCGGCDARWQGARVCHCRKTGCHRTFGYEQAYLLHHGARGRCLDPRKVLNDKGYPALKMQNGIWIGTGGYVDDE